MHKIKKFFFVQLCLLVSVFLYGQPAVAYKPVELPAGFKSQLNVVYTTVNGWEGKMDIYLPPHSGKPSPIVINIHGGGWNKGVKESQTGFNSFFKQGFAVANIEYRLTGQATAPAAVEDTRCALIYLIKNAGNLNIDRNKIVIMGGSAGGHLALMGGLLGNDRRFDNNCPGVDDIKVAAIINKYGITDVWDWGYGPVITSKSARSWLGEFANNKDFAQSVSPINYINEKSPPIFIVHGNKDPIVPYQQSVDLHKKLVKKGVINTFITVDGGLHGKFNPDKNREISKSIIDFILGLDTFKQDARNK